MPLNTMLAGAALLEFLAYFTGFRAVRTFFRFNVAENRITEQRGVRNADCPVCAPAYGMGDRHGIERYSLS